MSDTEFDAAVAAALAPEPAQAARVGFDAAVDTNPDAYAEARRAAQRTGVPVDTALALPKEVARQATLGTINFDTLAKTAPATARLLADHDRARLAHDNVDNMGEIERKLRQFGGGAVEAVGMALGGTGQLLDIAQRNTLGGLANLILPRPMARGQATNESIVGPLIGEDWRTVGGAIKRTARDDMMVPASQQTFGDQVASGLGQVLGQIAMLPFARGAGLYAQGADAMAEKITPDDASQGRQDLAVLGGAAITGITEKWALDRLLGPLAVPIKNRIGASLARIGVAAAAEGGQEFAENVLQDTLRVVLTNPDAPIDIGQSIGEGGVGAAVGGIVRSVVEAGLHIRTRGARAEVGQQQAAELIGNLNRLAAADKVLARDPETFEQWVAEATEDGPVGQVFVDAQALMQSGVAEQVAELSPAVAEQLPAALETGGTIAIPIEEYTARIAPTEFSAGLLDHLKVDPEGFSRAEAQEYMQSGMAAEFEAEVDRTLAEKEGDATFKASADAVKAEVKSRLDAVKRFRPEVNDAYATMVGSFYAVTAAKVGVTPEELFQRYPLAVSAERVAGTGFDQIAWHGTPHVWPPEPGFPHGRPRLDKMGSGEGAQVYGWGWYSAEAQRVAESYMEVGDKRKVSSITLDGKPLDMSYRPHVFARNALADTNGDISQAIAWLDETKQMPGMDRHASAIEQAKKVVKVAVFNRPSSLYQLDIPDDVMPKLLDWDKPLSEQSPEVQNALREAEIANRSGQDLLQMDPTGEAIVSALGRDEVASEYLASLGIPGLRYLDGSSRSKGAGTYNYVIWDQKVLDRIALLERNGEKLDALREADTAARELNQPPTVAAARAESTGKTSPITRKPIFELFDSTGGSIGLTHSYDTADAAVAGHNAPKPPTPAAATYTLPPAEFQTRSNWKQVKAQQFSSLDADDGYLYHVTAAPNAAGIREKGVTPGGGETFDGGYKGYSRGKAFVTERSGVSFWVDRVEQALFHSMERPPAVVVMRIPKSKITAQLTPDDAGTKDANARAYYATDTLFQSGQPFDGQEVAATLLTPGATTLMVDGVERPALNSDGKPIHWSEEGVRNFWRWFGNSKAVDADDRPLVVYHASPHDIQEYKTNQGVIWFTDMEGLFKDGRNRFENAVYLKINHPFDISGASSEYTTETWRAIFSGQGLEDAADQIEFDSSLDPSDEVRFGYLFDNADAYLSGDTNIPDILSRTGYDGIFAPSEIGETGSDKTYLVFDPHQIKSATDNSGEFSPADASILNQSGDAPRGRFNPDTLTVTLLKGADLSTFLHESGHFFLEVQFDLAAKLRKDAEALGADTLKPGERQLLADTDALLQWFGVPDLATWYSLDFEAKRGHHEKFARGFEAYLFEGKAPSIELHGLFQRFRAWLLRVYRELKNLNVKLTDEVRGTFDRMLATSEQITLAEQGRGMMALFASAQQAGMAPEEFAEYQALGTEATAQAIDDLQARGMRDMAWSRNARGRAVKRLQKEAREKRAEVEMEVRREVMSQPVYRAWQFLTGKLTADDRIKNPEPPKSSPDVLDETIDSLFVAVAKLGGIDKAEALGTWGIDPADKPQSGVFGKPVWRQQDGLSLDGMAEALAQYGYLDLDPNGKVDLRDFEERFKSELAGSPVYSNAYDYGSQQAVRPGDQLANPQALGAARLAIAEVEAMGLPPEVVAAVKARRMTATNGLHPDVAADIIGDFTSGDELVRALAEATPPRQEIDARTDALMLERFGDLSSPEAIERAADEAIHNDVRARFIAAEANALAKATGRPRVLASAAREYARAVIARLKVRNVRAGQYTNAEARAARAAAKAFARGDIATAAVEKRNQVIHNAAARAALNAMAEIDRGLRYLRKFDTRTGSIDAEYSDQIERLLERFDLRKSQSNKAVGKRAALAEWIKAQNDMGIEPDISPELANEAFRTSYKNLTVEEFRGLVDAVRQIEHLGRLKHRLLTARDKRTYEAIRDEIADSIRANAQGRQADTRTATTTTGSALERVRRFWASHIKAATWARIMDGGVDGGAVWEHFVRSANERGDRETTMRAEATTKLSEILAPVFALGPMGGNGIHFPTIGRSLNRMARLAIALNTGNEGNLQRLLGGENWTRAQLDPVLQSLSPAEWQAVQAIWDHFESYRPQIAAKERRVYGKEPEWVEPRAFTVTASDGTTVALRGGYYPIKFDPRASQRAEEHADAEGAKRQMQGAYTSATTRRSFTKTRVEEVKGRPLLYTLAGLYSGVNEVIHDLSWHEWLIDANRLLRSHTIDAAIREHYGPEVKQQLKAWVQDIADGDKPAANAGEAFLGRLRQGVSAAGLGFNVMSAVIQPLGLTQSVVRVGARWIGRGVAKYLGGPVELTRKVNQMSSFMENRARTRFRELNELRNRVQDQSAFSEFTGRYAYFLMMRCQQMVDVPTWWGAYEKAIAAGEDDNRAVALADQAVIDAQGGGQTKDLSGIERGGQALRLFTVFYSFMNTALNVGVSQTMTADTPQKRAKLAVDYLLLYVAPVVLGFALKNAITPGDSGDDDWGKVAKKLVAEEIGFLMGLLVVVREFSDAGKIVAGLPSFGYQGPAGVRIIPDSFKLAQQARQGEFDDAFRKTFVNVVGDAFGLPAAQANRTITGAQALAEGKTDNPAAIAFGFQEAR